MKKSKKPSERPVEKPMPPHTDDPEKRGERSNENPPPKKWKFLAGKKKKLTGDKPIMRERYANRPGIDCDT